MYRFFSWVLPSVVSAHGPVAQYENNPEGNCPSWVVPNVTFDSGVSLGDFTCVELRQGNEIEGIGEFRDDMKVWTQIEGEIGQVLGTISHSDDTITFIPDDQDHHSQHSLTITEELLQTQEFHKTEHSLYLYYKTDIAADDDDDDDDDDDSDTSSPHGTMHMILHATGLQGGAFGMALSESGGMTGADFFLYAPKDDPHNVHDYWVDGFSKPFKDQFEHITTHSVSTVDDDVSVHFSRPLDTHDPYDIVFSLNRGEQTVLWYIDPGWGDGGIIYHASENRGFSYVDFSDDKIDASLPVAGEGEVLCELNIFRSSKMGSKADLPYGNYRVQVPPEFPVGGPIEISAKSLMELKGAENLDVFEWKNGNILFTIATWTERDWMKLLDRITSKEDKIALQVVDKENLFYDQWHMTGINGQSVEGLDEAAVKAKLQEENVGTITMVPFVEALDPANPYLHAFYNVRDLINAQPPDPRSTEDNPQGCDVFKADSEDTLYHAIWGDVIPDKQNGLKFLHHSTFYSCRATPEYLSQPIFKQEMSKTCDSVELSWAPGFVAFVAPEEAGLPIGGPAGNFVAMETHFYNPDLVAFDDNTGYKLVLTNKIRDNDLSTLMLSAWVIPFAWLGPLEPSITYGPDYCELNCQDGNWAEEVNVTGVFHHMHKMGLAGSVEVIRDGENLGPISQQGRYDFKHQRFLPPRITSLKPGDTLTAWCTWKTQDKPVRSTFGHGTQEEMCIHLVQYWPKQDLKWCDSSRYGEWIGDFDFTRMTTKADFSTYARTRGANALNLVVPHYPPSPSNPVSLSEHYANICSRNTNDDDFEAYVQESFAMSCMIPVPDAMYDEERCSEVDGKKYCPCLADVTQLGDLDSTMKENFSCLGMVNMGYLPACCCGNSDYENLAAFPSVKGSLTEPPRTIYLQPAYHQCANSDFRSDLICSHTEKVASHREFLNNIRNTKCDLNNAAEVRAGWQEIEGWCDGFAHFWAPKSHPAQTTLPMLPPVVTNPNECTTHGDCDSGMYCVNGQKAFSPTAEPTPTGEVDEQNNSFFALMINPMQNICKPLDQCCHNGNAVGPSGETDRLYGCPPDATCRTWYAKAEWCYPKTYCHRSNSCLDLSSSSCEEACVSDDAEDNQPTEFIAVGTTGRSFCRGPEITVNDAEVPHVEGGLPDGHNSIYSRI